MSVRSLCVALLLVGAVVAIFGVLIWFVIHVAESGALV